MDMLFADEAEEIVDRVLDDLRARRSIGQQLYQLDTDSYDAMVATLITKVNAVLENCYDAMIDKTPEEEEEMRCTNGGEVTFTKAEPGYRLRIANGSTLAVILSLEEVQQLQARIDEVLGEEDDDLRD